MKQRFNNHLWKRGVAFGLSFAMAASLIPAMPARGEGTPAGGGKTIAKPSNVTKAGSVTMEGSQTGQPFAKGTAGSANFRAPAMITMDNGSILAVAEADWDGTARKNGTDIAASVSSDGGNTWQDYSFPFYFPDSEGYNASGAATFTAPSVMEGPDGKVYCFVNAFPAGGMDIAEHNHGSGYVDAGGAERYLALTEDGETSGSAAPGDDLTAYPYYIGAFAGDGDASYAPVKNRSDNTDTAYYVDAWYNLYEKSGESYEPMMCQGNTAVQQNVFYEDSKFHVYKIGYTWMVASEDYGKTWGSPRNITDQVSFGDTKNEVRLISTGRGITTQGSGDIVLGIHYHGPHMAEGMKIGTGVISSSDNGRTWAYADGETIQNTNDVDAGQNKLVELSDGTLRMFFGNTQSKIFYIDAKKGSDGTYVFEEERVETDALLKDSNASRCNLSAISYSKEVNGRQMILVSAPKGPQRADGRIFAFLVNDDAEKTMELASEFKIPDTAGSFEYSSMTELEDGSIGLLWESKVSEAEYAVQYRRLGILEVAKKLDVKEAAVNVNLELGQTYRRECYGDTAPTAPTGVTVADVETGTGVEAKAALYDHAGTTVYEQEPNPFLNLEDAEFVFTKTNVGENTWSIYNEETDSYYVNDTYTGQTTAQLFATADQIGDKSEKDRICVTPVADDADGSFTIKKYSGDSNVYRALFYYYAWNSFATQGSNTSTPCVANLILLERKASVDSSDIIQGYQRVTQIKDGGRYLIVCRAGSNADDSNLSTYLLYPTVGAAQSADTKRATKKVGASSEQSVKQTKYVAFTAKKAGFQSIVVDGVTYRVNVTGFEETDAVSVNLAVGETWRGPYYADGTSVTEVSEKDAIADIEVETSVQVTAELFDHDSSGTGFSSTKNDSLILEDAECEFTKTGEKWSIYNEKTNSYFINNKKDLPNEHLFISKENVDSEGLSVSSISLTNKEGFFDITNDVSRKLYFLYTGMNFSSGGGHNDSNSTWKMSLLKKKTSLNGEEPEGSIKGYESVNEPVSGEKYLIVCCTGTSSTDTSNNYYLLYPVAGALSAEKLNVTKKVGSSSAKEAKRPVITAKAPGCLVKEVNGVTYRIQVTGENPTHGDGMLEDRNQIPAGCYDDGYTGDKVCPVCQKTIVAGTSVPATGHTWVKDGGASKELTVDGTTGEATANGVNVFTCSEHKKTETIHAYAYNALKAQKEKADAALGEGSKLTAELKAELQAAYDSLKVNDVFGAKNSSAAMYRTADALKVKLDEVNSKNCTCEISDITVTPEAEPTAPLKISMKADGSENTLQLAAKASMAKECFVDGHPEEVTFAYRVEDSGTTGATVTSKGAVSAIASGTAKIEVAGTVRSTGKSFRKTVDVEVEREGQSIDGCICTVKGIAVEEESTKIKIKPTGVGSNTSKLALSVEKEANGCTVEGHPDGNGVSYRYKVKDAGETGAAVNAEGVVSVSGVGKAVIQVTAVLACGAEKSIDVTVTVAYEELSKAGSVSGTAETKTKEQPFIADVTAGRKSFDAPAMIVKQRGENADMLVAAADAKYDTSVRRAGGVDIVASASSDGGTNWTYSFPIRFPDSDANAQANSTTINNPALVEDAAGKIYCFANVNPTGVTGMMTGGEGYQFPNVGTGYIEVSGTMRLALTGNYANANRNPKDSTVDEYEYYVGDWAEGEDIAPVLSRADNTESEYGVDKWFNLYEKKEDGYEPLVQKQATETGVANGSLVVQQNVFYAGSALHVYNTGYLMCVTSTDGKNWGDPQILNPFVKKENDQALLVASGKGLLTSLGRLVIPVYRRNDGSKDVSSIVWLDLDGHWQRSADVPMSSDVTSSSEGEIVEISDGHLRLVFRNETGLICYADAHRDGNDIFTFTEPVQTGTAAYAEANVTAVRYQKLINGRQGLFIAAPSTGSKANGRIFTFLGRGDANRGMVRLDEFTVPGSSGYFGDSCLVVQNNGNHLGLLWENTNGGLRYSKYGIMDVVKTGYIPNVTIDVNLVLGGDPYVREYTVEGKENLNGVTKEPDGAIVSHTFDRGEAETAEVPSLYKHVGDTAAFEDTVDEDADITKAEFTISRPSNLREDEYVVYSEGMDRYLSHRSSVNDVFTPQYQNNITITKYPEGSNTFRIRGWNNRQFLFGEETLQLNAQGGGSAVPNGYTEALTFLEKVQEEASPVDPSEGARAEQPIPGYQAVDTITPGRKYLITHTVDGVIYIVYPFNGWFNSIRKVEGVRTVEKKATKRLTITPVSEGKTSMVANNVTYQITCLNNNVKLPSNGRKFFAGASMDNSSTGDATIASLKEGTYRHGALRDRSEDKDQDLGAYAGEAVEDLNELDFSRAEFLLEETEDQLYTFYNQATEQYLRNASGSDWYGREALAQELAPVETSDGTSFRILHDNRYMIYNYAAMKFDAYGGTGYARGAYDLELLERQELMTGEDTIPGYVRVDKVTPGKFYLIAEFYHDLATKKDVIFILYPNRETTGESKMYEVMDEVGVWLAAAGRQGQTADVTVNGIRYEVELVDPCSHEGAKRQTEGFKEAECEAAGYTGDVYCYKCNGLIESGEVTQPLGHEWGEWIVDTEPTFEVDGTKHHICSRCGKREEGSVSSEEYVANTLKEEIANAKKVIDAKDSYEASSIADLQKAYDAAMKLAETAAKAEKVAAIVALREGMKQVKPSEEFAQKKKAFTDLLNAAKTEAAKTDVYTAASLAQLQAAIDALKPVDEYLTISDLTEATASLQAAKDALKTIEQDKCEKLIAQIQTALANAKGEIDQEEASEEKFYTAESLANLKKVYGDVKAIDLTAKNSTELKELLNQVKAAHDGLETVAYANKKVKLQKLIADAKENLGKTDLYTAESLAALKAALDEVEGVDPAIDTIDGLIRRLESVKLQLINQEEADEEALKCEKLKKDIANALLSVKSVFDEADGTYTADSLAKLKAAVDAVEAEGALEGKTSAQLKEMLDRITKAYADLEPIGGISGGDIQSIKKELKTTVAVAAIVYEGGQSDYTEESWNAFQAAYEAANLSEDEWNEKTASELKKLLDDLREASRGLTRKEPGASDDEEQLKSQIRQQVSEAQERHKEQGNYTDESWTAFQKALSDAAEEKLSGKNSKELQAILDRLKAAEEALTEKKPDDGNEEEQQKCEQLKGEIASAVNSAKAAFAAGSANYTPESWSVFEAAYKAVNGVDLSGKNSAELDALLKALQAAYAGLKPKEPAIKPGASYPSDNKDQNTYQVVSVTGNTATVTITKGKNAKKALIPKTVTIKGVTCKVVGIAKNAFKNKSKLTTVVIHENITSIGDNAFSGCKKVTSVTIGKNVKTIGKKAFYNCKKLNKILFKGKKLPTVKKGAFQKVKANATVTLPKGIKKKQRTAFVKKLRSVGGLSKKAKIK